jgi:hypothetical protein
VGENQDALSFMQDTVIDQVKPLHIKIMPAQSDNYNCDFFGGGGNCGVTVKYSGTGAHVL